jgi:hypothetical protein
VQAARSPSLDGGLHTAESGVQACAQARHHGNDRYRDTGGDEPVLDGGCTRFVLKETHPSSHEKTPFCASVAVVAHLGFLRKPDEGDISQNVQFFTIARLFSVDLAACGDTSVVKIVSAAPKRKGSGNRPEPSE